MKNDSIYKFSFPLTRTHLGVPLGNGGFGALVWGKDGLLNITVSRNDFWDHRNGQIIKDNGISYKKIVKAYAAEDFDKIKQLYASSVQIKDGNFPSTLLPGGRFELKLTSGGMLKEAELDISSGKLRIRLASSKVILLCLSMSADILRIEDKDGAVDSVEGRPAWDFLEPAMKERLFDAPTLVNEKNLCGWMQNCPADPSQAALCEKNESGFIINLALGDNNEKAYAKSLSAINEYKCHEEDFLKRDAVLWEKYWCQNPEIDIPAEFLNRFYPFALYRFACAANPSATKPCPLQGPWLEEYQLPSWGGNYTVNVNIEQIYTLAFHTGNFDFLKPLFNMLESEPFRQAMAENAKSMFGIDDGYLLTHSVNDLGMQCQNGFSTHSALDHAVTAWMAQLYWLYYRYSLDADFLRDKAYPFMLRVMRVFEEMIVERDGKLSIPLAPSPEYGVCFKVGGRNVQEGRDPSMQLASVHMLADALIETAKIIGIKPREKWFDIKKRLPLYTLIGEQGNQHIALWEGQDLDVCHRHHSHLACIYPFDTLRNISPEQQHIIDNSIDHWILKGMGEWSEWCYPWAAIIQARQGFKEAPTQLLDIWKEIFINESMATVYLPKFRGLSAHRRNDMLRPKETSEIIQLDGTMAGATAILEMLVHERQGVVHLFPGVPDKWQDISFKNIRLPGAFLISAERKNGRITLLNIKSLKGGMMKLKADDNAPVIQLQFSSGEEKDILSRFQTKPAIPPSDHISSRRIAKVYPV